MKSLTTKRLSLLAMFIALQIVLSKFLMLQLAPSVRLSIDSVPILLAGLWFGPLAGALVGTLADFLGTLLFDRGRLFSAAHHRVSAHRAFGGRSLARGQGQAAAASCRADRHSVRNHRLLSI